MVDLAEKLNWDFAMLKSGESRENQALRSLVLELAAKSSICIAEQSDGVGNPKGVFVIGDTADEGKNNRLFNTLHKMLEYTTEISQ